MKLIITVLGMIALAGCTTVGDATEWYVYFEPVASKGVSVYGGPPAPPDESLEIVNAMNDWRRSWCKEVGAADAQWLKIGLAGGGKIGIAAPPRWVQYVPGESFQEYQAPEEITYVWITHDGNLYFHEILASSLRYSSSFLVSEDAIWRIEEGQLVEISALEERLQMLCFSKDGRWAALTDAGVAIGHIESNSMVKTAGLFPDNSRMFRFLRRWGIDVFMNQYSRMTMTIVGDYVVLPDLTVVSLDNGMVKSRGIISVQHDGGKLRAITPQAELGMLIVQLGEDMVIVQLVDGELHLRGSIPDKGELRHISPGATMAVYLQPAVFAVPGGHFQARLYALSLVEGEARAKDNVGLSGSWLTLQN